VKWVGIFFIAALVVFFAAGAMLSLASREGGPPGLVNGHLSPCPTTPNCVCSECKQEASFILPIDCEGDPDASWRDIQRVLREMGAEISEVKNGYLAATFETPLFRFVDDVELRLDRHMGVIDVRSASRVGKGDLGTNRKRVEEIRRRFRELTGQ
jgi:uncharacterized protein (DUF1499 family)